TSTSLSAPLPGARVTFSCMARRKSPKGRPPREHVLSTSLCSGFASGRRGGFSLARPPGRRAKKDRDVIRWSAREALTRRRIRCTRSSESRKALRHLRAVRQDRQQVGDAIAQLTPVADHVDRAVFQQEFGTLETFRQRLAHGLLDH